MSDSHSLMNYTLFQDTFLNRYETYSSWLTFLILNGRFCRNRNWFMTRSIDFGYLDVQKIFRKIVRPNSSSDDAPRPIAMRRNTQMSARGFQPRRAFAAANQRSRAFDRGYACPSVTHICMCTARPRARTRARARAHVNRAFNAMRKVMQRNATQRNATQRNVKQRAPAPDDEMVHSGAIWLTTFWKRADRSWACVETLGCRTGLRGPRHITSGQVRALWWTRQVITRVETTMRGARHSRHSRARARAGACMRACETLIRIPEGTPEQHARPRRGSVLSRGIAPLRGRMMEMNFLKRDASALR